MDDEGFRRLVNTGAKEGEIFKPNAQLQHLSPHIVIFKRQLSNKCRHHFFLKSSTVVLVLVLLRCTVNRKIDFSRYLNMLSGQGISVLDKLLGLRMTKETNFSL